MDRTSIVNTPGFHWLRLAICTVLYCIVCSWRDYEYARATQNRRLEVSAFVELIVVGKGDNSRKHTQLTVYILASMAFKPNCWYASLYLAITDTTMAAV